MSTFYTVDRSGQLVAGQDIGCDRDYSSCRFYPVQNLFTRSDLETLVNQLFPRGLAWHGKKYLLDECLVIPTPQGPAPAVPHIPIIELVSELVRRAFFPEKPSRLMAVFSWQTVAEAIQFQTQHGSGTIYTVEADTFFRGDMSLLLLGGSGVGAIHFAMKYWRGEAGPTPRWEYLLVPPVRVIGVVQSNR